MKKFYQAFLLISLFSLPFSAEAQNSVGFLTGNIVENSTNQTLPGANVWVDGTTIGTITDVEGNYVLSGLKTGEYTINVRFLGYQPFSTKINIIAGKNELNVVLESNYIMVDEVVVSALYKGQQKAINQQVNADQLVNIVSEDRIKELPDVNAAESIGRLPGVSVLRSGGEGTNIVIRGLEPKFSAVTVNGMRLPSTASDTRSTGLGSISTELLSGIEVYKSPTPDMDAEAIGGTVNLTMKKAAEGFESAVKVAQITNFTQLDPLNYKASAQLSNRFFNNKVGIIAQGNAEHINRSSSTLFSEIFYNADVTPNVYESKTLKILGREQYVERYGGSVNIDYNHKFGSLSLFSFGNMRITDFWEEETNFGDNSNVLHYNITEQESRSAILNNSLNGDLNFSYFSIEYSGAYSKINNTNPTHYNLNFQDPSVDYSNPDIDFIAHPELVPSQISRSRPDSLYLFKAEFEQNPATEQNAIGKIDVKVPLNISFLDKFSAYLKFGASVKKTVRERSYILDDAFNIYYLESEARGIVRDWTDLNGTIMTDANLERFYMGNLFDINNIESKEYGKDPLTGVLEPYLDRNATNQLGAIGKNYAYRDAKESAKDYMTDEMVIGTYAMLNFDIGRKLRVITGVRNESSRNIYQGIWSNEYGQPNDIKGSRHTLADSTQDNHLLPHLHIRFKATDWFDLRFSKAVTLSRPSYSHLIPSYSFNSQNSTARAGNPNLKPFKSDNYDLTASFYSSRYGLLRIGGFYKKITDPYMMSEILMENDSVAASWGLEGYTGFILTTPVNLPTGEVWGYEFELQTNLSYLPKPFNGIVLSFNMSKLYSTWNSIKTVYNEQSIYDPITGIITKIRSQEVSVVPAALPSLVPTTFNAVLGYNYKGFMCRMTANYQSDAVRSISSTIVALNDRYTYPAFRLDFSAKQNINDKVSITLNFANITSERERQYVGDRRYIRQDFHYGMTSELGIRVQL